MNQKDMILFEKQRVIRNIVRKHFPNIPVYFYDFPLGFGGTQYSENYELLHFIFDTWYLRQEQVQLEECQDLALHEIAHAFVHLESEHDGHCDKWLKKFYEIGGNKCWGINWYNMGARLGRQERKERLSD